MKLLQRSSRYYLLCSLFLFGLTALVLFFALRLTLNHGTDETLMNTRRLLTQELASRESLRTRMEIMDEIIELRPILAVTGREAFRDTLISTYDVEEAEWEMEPYRKYSYDAVVRGQPYRISLSLSTLENEDLIETLLLVVTGGLLALLLAINLLNRYLSVRLWKPFYATVAEVKAFSTRRSVIPAFPPSETDEFTDLNRELQRMTGQLQREYDSLRQFTENASHEIQTPLAIIRNHVDLLLRDPDRPEADYHSLQRISEAVTRLSRLNKTLLLLTKIEHDQFPPAAPLAVHTLLREKLEQLTPALAEKGIQLATDVTHLTISLPLALADVLLNNLLGNAVRHNLEGGRIAVTLRSGQLVVENTGPDNSLRDEQLFERFRKQSSDGNSLGLGLALVREICDRYGFGVRYDQYEGMHRVTVTF